MAVSRTRADDRFERAAHDEAHVWAEGVERSGDVGDARHVAIDLESNLSKSIDSRQGNARCGEMGR